MRKAEETSRFGILFCGSRLHGKVMHPAQFLSHTLVCETVGQTVQHRSHQSLAQGARHATVHMYITVANVTVKPCEKFVTAITTQNNLHVLRCQPRRLIHTCCN